MGLNRFYWLTIGIELSRSDYFEEYQGIRERDDCGHENKGDGQFCQICGSEKPEKKTLRRLDPDPWPEPLLRRLREVVQEDSLVDDVTDITSISEFNMMRVQANGLHLYGQHEVDGIPRLFLGKRLAHVDPNRGSEGNKWDREDLNSIFDEVDTLLDELGFEDEEPKLIFHDDIM